MKKIIILFLLVFLVGCDIGCDKETRKATHYEYITDDIVCIDNVQYYKKSFYRGGVMTVLFNEDSTVKTCRPKK